MHARMVTHLTRPPREFYLLPSQPSHLNEGRQRLLGDDRQRKGLAERRDVAQRHNARQAVIATEQGGGKGEKRLNVWVKCEREGSRCQR